MPQSVFRNALGFFGRIGIYDVVLPFLLVFTIMFAVLEKTNVLGVEKKKDGETSKSNLNAMVAFVAAFLVVASSRLVAIISEVMASVVLLSLLSICFLMLVGTFMGTGEFSLKEHKGWFGFFMVAMFIGVVLIFLSALGWLTEVVRWLKDHWTENATASIILVLVIIGFIVFITYDFKGKERRSGE